MRTIMLGAVAAGLASTALTHSASALKKAELDGRIHKLTAKSKAVRLKAEKAVPLDCLRKARRLDESPETSV